MFVAFRSNLARRLLLVAAAACSTISFASAVRADGIDVELMKRAGDLRDYLLERRMEAVGVLAFRLQRGSAPPSFQGGLIINSLPERVETALLMSLEEGKHPLRIVHDASTTATASLGAANYRTRDERARLFGVKYRQAWGNPAPWIEVDAMVTGKVIVAADLSKVTVEIEAFDRRHPETVTDVLRFDARLDRNTLAEVGYGYSLSAVHPGKFLRAVTEDDIIQSLAQAVSEPVSPKSDRPQDADTSGTASKKAQSAEAKPAGENTTGADKAAVGSSRPYIVDDPAPTAKPTATLADGATAANTTEPATPSTPEATAQATSEPTPAEEPKRTPVQPVSLTVPFPASALPVQVSIYYDDQEVPLEPDADIAGGANFTVRTPRQGERLKIGLKNLTDEKIGVVVTVNGVSTLYEEKGQANVLKKWALDPKSEYMIQGYYQAGNESYKEIRALSDEESSERFADLGGEAAAGLIHVYVFRSLPELSKVSTTPSIRRMSDSELAEGHAGTLSELQSLIVPGKFNRGLFAWSDTREQKLTGDKLGPVEQTDAMIIRYYRPSRVR